MPNNIPQAHTVSTPKNHVTTQIVAYIRELIIQGELLEGDRIQEVKICNALNVSRGSVREALLILERSFLIEIIPKKGAIVSAITIQHVHSLFEVFELYVMHIVSRASHLYQPEERKHIETMLSSLSDIQSNQYLNFIQQCLAILDTYTPILANPFLSVQFTQILPAIERSCSLLLSPDLAHLRLLQQYFIQANKAIFLREGEHAAQLMQQFMLHLKTAIIQSLMRMKQIELALAKRKGR